ncbi:MAG TPA: cytidine deaminase [Terriglobia bacterium]|nr:cytidine deaminase [Terriglobia bacterium]
MTKSRKNSAANRGGGLLLRAARLAWRGALAPYSNFKVGAALRTGDGAIITGCNIENAIYSLSLCAERVALFKALSEGHKHFTSIAIVADTEDSITPCGACRQLLWEFGGNVEVISGNLKKELDRRQLERLLPYPFDNQQLQGANRH